MADTKISALPLRANIAITDEVPTLVGGVNYRSPLSAIISGVTLPTRTAAMAALIPAGVNEIQTLSYATPGDGGGASYKRVVSPPTHAGKFQDVGGAWWEYVLEGPMRIEQFGGVADSTSTGTPATDNLAPLYAAISVGNSATVNGGTLLAPIVPKIEFRVGNYYFSDTIDIRARVWLMGQSTGQYSRNGGTTFHFPIDITGIRFQGLNTAGAAGRALANWVSGTNYSVGDHILYTVDVNKFYKCTTDGPGTSTVQPSHTTVGAEIIGSDGYGWTYLGLRSGAGGSICEGITVVQNVLGSAALHTYWVSGTNYSTHVIRLSPDVRQFYKCTTDGGVSSTVPPSGTVIGAEVIGADGFGWTYLGGNNKAAHSFHTRTQITFKNCFSYCASGDGFALIATAGSLVIEGNVNNWTMYDCYAEEFGGNGIRVSGQDTNGGRCYNFTTKGGADLDMGCGIYDDSGWACTYVTPQITGYGNCGVHKDGIWYQLISQTIGIGGSTTPGTNDNVWYPIASGQVVSPTRYPEWVSGNTYKLQIPIFSSNTSAAFIAPYVEGAGVMQILGACIAGNAIPTNLSPAMYPLAAGDNALMSRTGVGAYRSFIAGTPGYTNNGAYVLATVGSAVHPDENLMNVFTHTREIDGGTGAYSYRYTGGDLVYSGFNAKTLWHVSTATTALTYGRTLPVPHVISFVDYALRDVNNTNNWRIHGLRDTVPTAVSVGGPGEYARGEIRWSAVPTRAGVLGWVCTTGGALATAWVSGTNYIISAYIKTTAGRFYKCTVDAGTSSLTEPTHTSGAVTLEGFEWTYLTATEAVWAAFGEVFGTQTLTDGLAFTLSPATSPRITLYTGTMTADRIVTLSTSAAVAGMRWRITRTAAGAFNLNVGTGPLKAMPVNSWCEVVYDGTAWYLSAYGVL